jgi:hypothetical protein
MFAEDVAAAFYKALENHETDLDWSYKKEDAYQHNKWFVLESVNQSLKQWRNALEPGNVKKWLESYSIADRIPATRVGIIMAGNIPLVGMHYLI